MKQNVNYEVISVPDTDMEMAWSKFTMIIIPTTQTWSF